MKLKVLGCSGGFGGNLRTTSLLIDRDILIDAGTGVGDLSLAEMAMIDHVFITHSHLDHITSIPFMIDSVGFMRDKPLIVYATVDTIAILKAHLFNWLIWPDFNAIPNAQTPCMQYQTIQVGEVIDLNGRKITPLPVNHVVPAVGFRVDSEQATLVFSGDTTVSDAFWTAVNTVENLQYLIVETAFSNAEVDLALRSKHYCPSLLANDLLSLKQQPEIYITHLKPGEIELTMQEIAQCVRGFNPKMLQNGQVFEF